tara:strand:- start:3891 stop:5057 length:1167 start_codon:yes stop_codon:yes gene_type:complete
MKDEITSPNTRARKKVFMVSGGAGRIICALPAFQKYLKINGPDSFYIVSQSGLPFFLGTEFQDISFDPSHKGLFKDIIKDNNLINLEPYQEYGYYNQEKSLTESFDKLVNGTDDHEDLEKPKIILSKTEEINAQDIIAEVIKQQGKERTIVIQPFGRNGTEHKGGHVVDPTSRSLSTDDYFYISERLRKYYNVISMTEIKFDNDKNMYVDADLRHWAGIIDAADYFVGVDSCGQHMAYAFDKPGSVILGSTFAENISYPEHFNIVEKENNPKQYSPIRIDGMDGELTDRKNDTCMDYTKAELEDIKNKILKDIQDTIGEGGNAKKAIVSDTYFDDEVIPKYFPNRKDGAPKAHRKPKKSFNQLIDVKPVKTKSKKSIDKVLEKNNIES